MYSCPNSSVEKPSYDNLLLLLEKKNIFIVIRVYYIPHDFAFIQKQQNANRIRFAIHRADFILVYWLFNKVPKIFRL